MAKDAKRVRKSRKIRRDEELVIGAGDSAVVITGSHKDVLWLDVPDGTPVVVKSKLPRKAAVD